MTTAEVLVAAPRHGADALGIEDQASTVEPGKRADLPLRAYSADKPYITVVRPIRPRLLRG